MKTETIIGGTEKLDIIGIQHRIQVLSECSAEPIKSTTAMTVHGSYALLFNRVLGCSPYMFISINLESANIKRALDSSRRRAGGASADRFIRLGREYFEARHSGETARNALETLWNKLLVRVNRRVLGSKYKRYGQSLRSIAVYENGGKQFCSGRQTSHLHVLLEIPAKYGYQEFEHEFRQQFSLLVYPLSSTNRNDAVLNITPGRLTGVYPHPEYMQKQLVDWETASDRVSVSGIPVANGYGNVLLTKSTDHRKLAEN